VKRAIALVIAGFVVSDLPIAQADQRQRFTVIDRTMVCKTGFAGGVPDRIRTVTASVSARHGSEPAQFERNLSVNTGAGSGGSVLAIVYPQDAPRAAPYILVHRRRCTQLKKRLPLLSEERSAPAVDFHAGCRLLDAPARVVVRVRAELEAPASWSVYKRDYLRVQGTAVEALLAVRTHPARKPIAYASFARDGTARFFRSARCTE
jgi:hypothetical protein